MRLPPAKGARPLVSASAEEATMPKKWMTSDEALSNAREADQNTFRRKRAKSQAPDEVKHPRPDWMSDRSLLPKKPPGR